MSKALDVHDAVVALVNDALTDIEVVGLEDGAERAHRISPLGTVIIHFGDPGDPDIDLSPPIYHYEHRIPVQIAAAISATPLKERLDGIKGQIATAVFADRTLGGLVTWLDVSALDLADITVRNGQTQRGGAFDIIATYSTPTP